MGPRTQPWESPRLRRLPAEERAALSTPRRAARGARKDVVVTNLLLLELQRLDSRVDELRARRTGLPERTRLREGEEAMASIVRERAEAADRQATLAREERQVAGSVDDLEARTREVESTLYSGRVTAIRELEALQLELRECQRRQGEREDEELLVMEQQEQLDGEIAAMEARQELLRIQASELRAVIEAAESQIDTEIGHLVAQRSALAPQLPAAVLAVYEKLRSFPRLGGKVAVSVAGGACGGCKMIIPTILTSRLHRTPPDQTVQCQHCQRILVP